MVRVKRTNRQCVSKREAFSIRWRSGLTKREHLSKDPRKVLRSRQGTAGAWCDGWGSPGLRVKGRVSTGRVLGSSWDVWIKPIIESQILFRIEVKAMGEGSLSGAKRLASPGLDQGGS